MHRQIKIQVKAHILAAKLPKGHIEFCQVTVVRVSVRVMSLLSHDVTGQLLPVLVRCNVAAVR